MSDIFDVENTGYIFRTYIRYISVIYIMDIYHDNPVYQCFSTLLQWNPEQQ